MKKLLLALLFGLLTIAVVGQQVAASPPAEAEVRVALTKFLTAFENLDWDSFRSSFTDDASVFYPRAMPVRATGREQFEAGFKKVFEQIRGNQTSPPYMHIDPKDLRVEVFGDVAIVTFHLDDRPGFLNRRTVVMRKIGPQWKIVHLHASEVATDKKP